MNLSEVNHFLSQQQTCVLASINPSGQPEAATVGFSHDNKFKFLVATNKNTRKYQNLTDNPRVAVVVGVEGEKTLQYEGTAQEVSQAQLGERLEQHFQKVPGAKKFAQEAGQTYFLITPSWLRLTDYTQDSPVFETREFV